ncbi:MAG: SGNH/GDSL hydrolase family protein [Ruminococcus flavefaciens]|nr:SGNH/GDSL hydrolase family protein [Ruminococcus flavefaciens]
MEKTIICFGDSNTHGYDSSTGGRFNSEERYPCLLSKNLGKEYVIREEGLSGRTTVFDDPLFEGLNGLTAIAPILLTHEPVSLLTIMLGTNDVKERFCVNAENIAKGMERLVKKAISVTDVWLNQKPNILIIAPPAIEKGYENTFVAGEMGRGCAEKSKELAYYYKRTASLIGCHFLDAGEISGIRMHPNDYMHLDAASHRLLAQKLAEIIPTLF